MALTLLLGGQLVRLSQVSLLNRGQEDTTTLSSAFALRIYINMSLTVPLPPAALERQC